MPLAQGTVGPILAQDGANPPTGFRQGRLGDMVVSELHGRYFSQTFRGNMFSVATQAGQTTSAGLATTYVGLVVSNPLGSKILCVPNKISYAWTVIAAAVNAVGYGLGYSSTTNTVHTTPVTPRNNYFGIGPAPVCLADTAATLAVAPVYAGFLGDTPTATTNPNGGIFDLEGSIIIPPGGYICTLTPSASSSGAFFASISWEEIPAF